MKFVHLLRLTDPLLLTAIVGLTVTMTNIGRHKRGIFERGIFVGEMLQTEKQSEGGLGICNVYE